MLVKRKTSSILSTLKDFDAYAKPLDDFQVKTNLGGTITILSTCFIVWLLFAEFTDWAHTQYLPSLQVDKGRKEKLDIQLNISFPHVPCFLLSIDVMDVSGDHQNDVDHDIFKQRLDRNGLAIHDVEKGSVGETTTHEIVSAKVNGTGINCGSCYGAGATKEACCNTCADVQKAYTEKGWTLPELDTILQCKLEGVTDKQKEQMHEGCNIHGKLSINKVAGNIHFAPGKSFQQGNAHIHDLHEYMKSKDYDWTHTIHTLGFGEVVGFENPLDNVSKKCTQGWSTFTYYIKTVRTDFHFRNSTTVSTNQFSVTEHETITPPIFGRPVAMPGVFLSFEISPMLIIYKEYRKPFSHFLTDICAVVGGVFTVAGIVDGLLYSAEKRFKQKMEIGKAH